MKLFAVQYGYCGGGEGDIAGIFSTVEKAKAFLEARQVEGELRGVDPYITEVTLDVPASWALKERPPD